VHHIGDPKLRAIVEKQEREKKAKEKPISYETIYLWNLYQLKQQGYPFGRDEIRIEDWYSFAIVEGVINELKAEQLKHG